MSEKIKFTPEAVSEYQQKLEQLKEQGGFMLERDEENERNIISFLGAKEDIGGKLKEQIVEFETEIESREEAGEIFRKIRQTPLFRKIFTFIIESYNEGRIPLIQSSPGTGKTFSYKKFNELLRGFNDLLHGKRTGVEYIACTPKTSELDIIGHWAPTGGKESSKEDIEPRLRKNKKWQEFKESWDRKLETLFSQKDMIEVEEFQREFAELTEEYAEFQRKTLDISDGESSGWTFHRGVLLSGYQDPENPEDEGRMIIIDEIDNLPENYQNIFLQISGERGRLADEITAYSNSGTTKYRKGKYTFVVFAANYPELAQGKRSISAPLADRVDWLSITPEESLKDEGLRIEEYGFMGLFGSFESKTVSDKSKTTSDFKKELPRYREIELKTTELLREADPKIIENIRAILGRALSILHTQWKRALADYRKEGIEVAGGSTRGREQEKEFSQRAAVGFEDMVIRNLNNPAYVNPETGRVDLSEIFFDAFQAKYANFLASGKLRIRFQAGQLLPLLYGGRKEFIESDSGIEIKEVSAVSEQSPFLYVEDDGIFRPYNSAKDEGKEKFAMDQVLNILLEKASTSQGRKGAASEEEKEDAEKEKIKEELRELAEFQDFLKKDFEGLEKDVEVFCEFEEK